MALWRRGRSWYYDFWCKRQRYTGCFGPVAATTAKHLYTKAKAQALEGALGVSPKVKADPLFDQYAQEFAAYYRATRRPNSAVRCDSHIRTYLPFFGRKRLSHITVRDVDGFKAAQAQQGKAPATINRYLVILSQMFSTAQQWGKVASNPVQEVSLFRVRNARTRFLTQEEEAKLLAACGPP